MNPNKTSNPFHQEKMPFGLQLLDAEIMSKGQDPSILQDEYGISADDFDEKPDWLEE